MSDDGTDTGWEFEIQGKYDTTWEMVDTQETRPEADESLAVYRSNEPTVAFRVRRVPASS